MLNLFGGTLSIRDGFTRTLNSFASRLNSASTGFNNFTRRLQQSEASNRLATQRMQQQITHLANAYVRQGYTMQQAMEKASRIIRRQAPTSGNAWIDTFGRIRQVGNDSFNRLTQYSDKFGNSTLGTLSKLTAGFLSLKGASDTFKIGVSAASEFQNASVFLDAVYGKEGKEKYKWATQEANKTPFEEKEIASGLARTKSLGLKDDPTNFKMYEDLGSFAKIQGVGDLNSAIDAISDTMSGEWIRLQTITGTKRKQLEDFAKKKNLGKFTDKKGQVTNKETLWKVLKAYMDEKGISGMTDKFSKTFSGRISTLKGNFKKSLASLMGIAEDGTVKNGSLFDNLATGLEKFIKKINKFSESDSARKVGDFLGNIGSKINQFIDYISNHPEAAENLLKLTAGLVGLKIVGGLLSPITSIIGLVGSGSGLTSIFGKLSGGLMPLTAGFLALGSVLSDDGILHKGINSIINDIVGNQENEQKDYIGMSIRGWQYVGLEGLRGIKSLFGADTSSLDTKLNKMRLDDAGNAKFTTINKDTSWHTSKKLDGSAYKTIDNTKNLNSITNTTTNISSNSSITSNSSNNSNSTNNVNNNPIKFSINIDKVEKTADVDELANTMINKINRYYSTRNSIS